MIHVIEINTEERDLLTRLLKREYEHVMATFGALPVGKEMQREIQDLHIKLNES